ncbi:hypothetical protein M885DRAFT_618536 [Pelagophyceae sp. CCMP2097]|nr:hypothetical protein M885DRAFT_618536 [Pelagophyceae sp. CCMP2097]
MFFDPTISMAEELAAEEAAAARAPPAAPAAAPAAASAAPTKAAAAPPAKPREATTRLVSTIERVQVELQEGSVPGGTEQISLPDGRLVEFMVPMNFSPGDVIEVEVGRKVYSGPVTGPQAPISRDLLKTFFENGVAAMNSDSAKSALTKPSATLRPGPMLIELQQVEFDKLGVPRQAGCQAASQVAVDYASDAELLDLQKEFMMAAQRRYLWALREMTPKTLETKQPLPRKTILEFFDACNTELQLPEIRDKLGASFRKTKQMPNQVIIDLQRDMLEVLGWQRDWACDCLNRISSDFPNDAALGRAMQMWAMTAQGACKAAVSDGDPAMQADSAQMQDMQAVQRQASLKLASMAQSEKDAFLETMMKRIEVFQKLSTPDRLRYVSRLAPDDKLSFVMSQLLFMEQFQNQMGKVSVK